MTISDERLGFTEDEVIALMSYMGCSQSIDTAKRWYDGYRFGNGDVCNPWSVLNFIDRGCAADLYWGNTSGNAVVGDLIKGAEESIIEEVYGLLELGGVVLACSILGLCSLRWDLRAMLFGACCTSLDI